jgi:hypothetical protein
MNLSKVRSRRGNVYQQVNIAVLSSFTVLKAALHSYALPP